MLRQQHYYTNVAFGNCLDLPERYLWNEDICAVLAILSNKLIYM